MNNQQQLEERVKGTGASHKELVIGIAAILVLSAGNWTRRAAMLRARDHVNSLRAAEHDETGVIQAEADAFERSLMIPPDKAQLEAVKAELRKEFEFWNYEEA